MFSGFSNENIPAEEFREESLINSKDKESIQFEENNSEYKNPIDIKVEEVLDNGAIEDEKIKNKSEISLDFNDEFTDKTHIDNSLITVRLVKFQEFNEDVFNLAIKKS